MYIYTQVNELTRFELASAEVRPMKRVKTVPRALAPASQRRESGSQAGRSSGMSEKERWMLPWQTTARLRTKEYVSIHTHTHTHTHIYIYI